MFHRVSFIYDNQCQVYTGETIEPARPGKITFSLLRVYVERRARLYDDCRRHPTLTTCSGN